MCVGEHIRVFLVLVAVSECVTHCGVKTASRNKSITTELNTTCILLLGGPVTHIRRVLCQIVLLQFWSTKDTACLSAMI